MDVTESSTDTYGFGESGTETITDGGADAPGTLSFDWNQLGTDDYQIGQANSDSSSSGSSSTCDSYSLDLTDTVSSSWDDTGADELTDGDTVTGDTDNYTWDQFHSITADLTSIQAVSGSTEGQLSNIFGELVAGESDSFSIADVGCDTMSGTAVVAGTDDYTITDTLGNGGYSSVDVNVTADGGFCASFTEFRPAGAGYDLYDEGFDLQSGTASDASDTYTLDQSEYGGGYESGSEYVPSEGSLLLETDATSSYAIEADGTDSVGPDDAVHSTLEYDEQETLSESILQQYSSSVGFLYSSPLQDYSIYVADAETTSHGTCTDDDGDNAFSDAATDQQSLSSSWSGTGVLQGPWDTTYTSEAGPMTTTETGNETSGISIGSSGLGTTTTTYSSGNPPEGLYLLPFGGASGEQTPVENSLLSLVESSADIEISNYAYIGPGAIIAGDTTTAYLITLEYYSGDGNAKYEPPLSVDPYQGGEVVYDSPADNGFDPPGNLSNATAAPDTDSASADGLPTQEVNKLTNFVQNTGTSDGVSRGAAPSPTETLVALAAAGRNPTDITIPTQSSRAASNGSGGGEGSSGSGPSSGSNGPGRGGTGSSRSSRTRGGEGGTDDALVARSGGAKPSGVMVSQGVVSVAGAAGAGGAASPGNNGSTAGSGGSGPAGGMPDADPPGGGVGAGEKEGTNLDNGPGSSAPAPGRGNHCGHL